MDQPKPDEFSYQGYKIPLPGSISADRHNHQAVSNFNSIFSCDGHNCNLCEECLTRNMYSSSFGLSKSSKIPNSSEVSNSNTNGRKEKEQDRDTTSDYEIGEGKYFTTEKILLSILWSSIKQSELTIRNAEHSKTKSDTIGTSFKGSAERSTTSSDRSSKSLQDILNVNPAKKARTNLSDPVLAESKSENPLKPSSITQPPAKDSLSQNTNTVPDNSPNDNRDANGNPIDKNNDTTKAVKPALKKCKISCYGKIRDNEWGCHASFDSLDALKKHWGDAATGTICLQRFIDLRKG